MKRRKKNIKNICDSEYKNESFDFNGSPHPNGNTAIALQEMVKVFPQEILMLN